MSVDDYNQRVIGALEQAQARTGVRSAAAFARRLAERAGGTPDPSTYQRWLRGDSLAPAWALVAAAEEAGEGLDELLGLGGDDRLSQLEERLSHVEAALRGPASDQPRSGDWLKDLEDQSSAHREALDPTTTPEQRRSTGSG
ncbi:MAG: hypothetical protein ACRD0R_23885 [Acidimicrobiales bacterium]